MVRKNSDGDFGRQGRGLALDQAGAMPTTGQELRRHLARAGLPVTLQTFVLEGATVSTVTEIPLAIGGGEVLVSGEPGIPVNHVMRTADVAVSFLADNAPGDYTLRLLKRTPTTAFAEVATFTVTTTT